MTHSELLLWWFIGLMAFCCFGLILFRLSPEARLRRRRRKSHSRLVSKSSRPTVRFGVRPPKEK